MTVAGPEVPRLAETYFTPNPDATSPIGLLAVPVVGEDSLASENESFADVIRQALDLSRPDDPQAQLLEALYRGDGIPRQLMDSFQDTATDPIVALPLRRALNSLNSTFPGVVAMLDLKLLRHALNHNIRRGIVLLSGDGLRSSGMTDGSLQPAVEISSDELLLSEDEQRIAHQLGAAAFAYNMELVWQENSTGALEPRLLSRRIHWAVGRAAADGTIQHVATILDSQHPVRSVAAS